MVKVELIDPSSWERLREIRLRALTDTPDAFGSSRAREEGQDEAQWYQLASTGRWWVAVTDAGGAEHPRREGDVGLVAAGHRRSDAALWVYSMWVEPSWRGRGVATPLLDAVVGWAREERASMIGLDVADRAPRARRFYERYGFVANGVVFAMPRDESIELAEMTLDLSRLAGPRSEQ